MWDDDIPNGSTALDRSMSKVGNEPDLPSGEQAGRLEGGQLVLLREEE
jgi:hypothetical protein